MGAERFPMYNKFFKADYLKSISQLDNPMKWKIGQKQELVNISK